MPSAARSASAPACCARCGAGTVSAVATPPAADQSPPLNTGRRPRMLPAVHPADFTIEERTSGGMPVVMVRGRIGLAEAWTLEGRLLAAFARTDRLVVDLSAVDEVSGGLVGVLLRVRRHIAPDHGRLALVVGGPPVST